MSSLVLVSVIALVILTLNFDWDWFRPAVEHYVSYKSHRLVKADNMEVEFSRSLQPTLKFRNLYIQNAPWSSQKPLISAKEISFYFAAFRWPYSQTPGIVEISMSDGEANLERMQDGLRNWRLLTPEYRGPGKYLVKALQADRSIVRFTDHITSLNVVAQSSPIREQTSSSKDDSKVITPSPAELFSNHIIFSGTYHGQTFMGEAATGQRLTFQKTGETFPIRGIAHSGKMELHVDGKIGDIFKNQLIYADTRFSTPSASALNPFINKHLPDTRPINAFTRLVKIADEYRANGIRGKLGHTDVTGDITYIYNKTDDEHRSSLTGSLASDEMQLDDLLPMKQEPIKHGQEITSAASRDSISPLSRNAISPEILKSQDMDLSFNVHKLFSPALPSIENISMRAYLNNGHLKISPVHATMFGSAVTAELSMNAQDQPMSAHILIDAPNIAVNELLARTKWRDMVIAPLTAHINMYGVGNSPSSILGSAAGTMDFTVNHGEISDKLDAKMGLDIGKLVWLSIRGDKKIAVDHGAMHLVFKNGIGQSHDTAIETSQTIVQGVGSIDLHDKTLDFLLTPKPKDPTIFSLRSNIHIHGPLNRPAYQLEPKPLAASRV